MLCFSYSDYMNDQSNIKIIKVNLIDVIMQVGSELCFNIFVEVLETIDIRLFFIIVTTLRTGTFLRRNSLIILYCRFRLSLLLFQFIGKWFVKWIISFLRGSPFFLLFDFNRIRFWLMIRIFRLDPIKERKWIDVLGRFHLNSRKRKSFKNNFTFIYCLHSHY